MCHENLNKELLIRKFMFITCYDIMEILIQEPKHPFDIKWFRGISRYDTMTDVKFINKNTLIAANRECGKFYVVKFSLNPTSVNVVFTIDAIFNGIRKNTDLFTIDGNMIYFVSLDNTIGSLKFKNDTLILKDLITIPGRYLFHGITLYPDNKDIVYLASIYNPKLVMYNMKTKTILNEISLPKMETFLIKDIKFVDKNTIAVSGNNGGISIVNKNQTYNSGIGLYNATTFELFNFIELSNSHTDGLCFDGTYVYITCQGDSDENILKFKVEANKLIQVKGYSLPKFPHGIDATNGIVACTTYSNSSICVFQI